ncbi:hypothetical protein EP331_11560 [bacterium]|nr:MAG: hypothetical protein EP331_11560 [bacterium]
MLASEFRKLFLFSSLFWVIVSFFMMLTTVATMIGSTEPIRYETVWFYELACLFPWMVATPVIFWGFYKFPLNHDLTIKIVLFHILIALVVFVFHNFIQVVVNDWYWEDAYTFTWIRLRYDFIAFFQLRVLYYVILALLFYTYQLYKKKVHTRLEETRLRNEISKTKFEQLHANIHPYLMINSIDAAIQHCDTSPEKSEALIHRLSELIRIQLKKLNQEFLTIEQNHSLLSKYTELLSYRAQSSIPFQSHIASEFASYRVPSVNYIILLLEDLIYQKSDLLKTISSISYHAKIAKDRLVLQVVLHDAIVDSRTMEQLLSSTPFKLIEQSIKQQVDEEFSFFIDYKNGSLEIVLQIENISKITNRFNANNDVLEINYLRN